MHVRVFHDFQKTTDLNTFKSPQGTVESEVNEFLAANPDILVHFSHVNMACGEDWTEFSITLFYTKHVGWKLNQGVNQ